MLGDFVLELVTAIGAGLTITLTSIAPAGRLTWVSRFGAVRQPIYYVLDDTVQEEWGVGTWIPGAPNTITRDTVIGNSAGTTARLNFAGTTRCYNAPPSAFLWNVLGSNVGRNLFHNPLFKVQQRGAGPWTVNGSYTADRWLLGGVNGTNSVVIGAFADAGRVSIGDEQAEFYWFNTFTGSAAAGDLTYLAQRIENVRRLAGKTITISFWANTSAATPKIGVGATQVFGTGGSPSANVSVTAIPVSITATLTRYAVTLAIPSVSGKTFGSTAGTDYTQIVFWLSSGSTNNAAAGGIGVQSGNVALWGMQCEIAPAPSPLEKPDPEQDLAKCLRFYQKYLQVLTIGYGNAANNVYTDFLYPTAMRVTPSVTFANIVYTNCSALAANAAATHCIMNVNITALGAAWAYADFNFTADL